MSKIVFKLVNLVREGHNLDLDSFHFNFFTLFRHVGLLLDDVEVVPVADPHRQHGKVLRHDGQQSCQNDFGNHDRQSKPRISEKLFDKFKLHRFIQPQPSSEKVPIDSLK